MADSSNVSILTNIFTAPNDAFASLKERPRLLLPMLLLIVSFTVVSFYYLSHVDMGWFLDNQLRQGGAQLTDAQREQALTAAAKIPPVVYGSIGALSTNFFVFLVMAIVAGYYALVSFITGDGVTYKQWFALLVWCVLPQLLGQIAVLVNMSINDPRFMPQDSINPLSFGNLLSIDRTGVSTVQRVLLGIDVTAIWTLVLQVLGYQAFSKSSLVRAAAVVLGPLALIVAIITLLALRR
jgi:hypothetical protein